MKKYIFIISLIVVSIVLLLLANSFNFEEVRSGSSSQPLLKPVKELNELYQKQLAIPNLQYDTVTKMGTQHIWKKSNLLKIKNSSQNRVSYTLFKGGKTYVWSDESCGEYNVEKPKDVLLNPKAQVSSEGACRVDGVLQSCVIFTYPSGVYTATAKYWKEKGLPISISAGDFTTKYMNYDFNEIPDTEFNLPNYC